MAPVALAPFRSRKVLDHAKGQRCCLRLRGFCNRNPETTVSAHIRDRHKGMAVKASDHSVIFACAGCHAALDEGKWLGKLTEVEVLRAIISGLQETWEHLIADDIIKFPHDRRQSFHEKTTKPRKPKELRSKVPPSRPIENRGDWPAGRKIPSKKMDAS